MLFRSFRAQVGKRTVDGLAPWIEYDGPLGIQRLQFQPDGFPQPPPDTVAHDSFAQRARGGETDLVSFVTVDKAKSGEASARMTCPLVIDLPEFFGTQQPNTLGEAILAGSRDLPTSRS